MKARPRPKPIVPLGLLLGLLLAMAGPGLAANDFSTDPNCVAVWNLENSALTTDSQGTNTLTNSGVVADTVNFQQGAAAGDFESGDPDYMERADASLSAKFPLKTGDTNKKISVCFWMKPESVGSTAYPCSKFDFTNGKMSFAVTIQATAYIAVFLGHTAGTGYDLCELPAGTLTIVAGRWYFVAVTYDDAKKLCRVFVYGVTEGQWYSVTKTMTNNISVTDAPWRLGDRAEGSRPYDGLLDEVAVFKRVLRVGEITAIQAGSFVWPYSLPAGNNFANDSDCVALWRLESGPSLIADSIGTNDLTNVGVVADTVNFREGAAAGDWERDDNTDALSILDALLDPGFPFKSGDTAKKMSVCFWLQIESIPTSEKWLFGKVVTPNSFVLCINMWEELPRFYWRTWQLPAEARYSPYLAPLTPMVVGQWYHIGATLDGTDASYRIRIYDLTNDEVTDSAGQISDSTYVSATAAPLRIGGYDTNVSIDGRMDEVVVLKRILTPDEIDQIRGGTFGQEAGSSRLDWWWRRRHS